jgi:hypothetical protein
VGVSPLSSAPIDILPRDSVVENVDPPPHATTDSSPPKSPTAVGGPTGVAEKLSSAEDLKSSVGAWGWLTGFLRLARNCWQEEG